MGGKVWSPAEERAFWTVLVPEALRNHKPGEHPSPASFAALLDRMKQIGEPNRRTYTGQGLYEHWHLNVIQGTYSPNAKRHTLEYVATYNDRKRAAGIPVNEEPAQPLLAPGGLVVEPMVVEGIIRLPFEGEKVASEIEVVSEKTIVHDNDATPGTLKEESIKEEDVAVSVSAELEKIPAFEKETVSSGAQAPDPTNDDPASKDKRTFIVYVPESTLTKRTDPPTSNTGPEKKKKRYEGQFKHETLEGLHKKIGNSTVNPVQLPPLREVLSRPVAEGRRVSDGGPVNIQYFPALANSQPAPRRNAEPRSAEWLDEQIRRNEESLWRLRDERAQLQGGGMNQPYPPAHAYPPTQPHYHQGQVPYRQFGGAHQGGLDAHRFEFTHHHAPYGAYYPGAGYAEEPRAYYGHPQSHNNGGQYNQYGSYHHYQQAPVDQYYHNNHGANYMSAPGSQQQSQAAAAAHGDQNQGQQPANAEAREHRQDGQ